MHVKYWVEGAGRTLDDLAEEAIRERSFAKKRTTLARLHFSQVSDRRERTSQQKPSSSSCTSVSIRDRFKVGSHVHNLKAQLGNAGVSRGTPIDGVLKLETVCFVYLFPFVTEAQFFSFDPDKVSRSVS